MHDGHLQPGLVQLRAGTQRYLVYGRQCLQRRRDVSGGELHAGHTAQLQRRQRVHHRHVQPRYRLRQLSAHQRRGLYEQEGLALIELRRSLEGRLGRLHTGRLVRVVLDVEQGAIYYYEVSREPARHLVAVTLDQDHVYTVDAELEALKGTLRRLLGLPRI